MSLLRVAKAPTAAVQTGTVVMDAIRQMQKANVGAVIVLEGEKLKGMFTERDVMLRVVLAGKDPNTTPVSEVMTKGVMTVTKDTKPEEAVKAMWEKHIRHLPVIREDGTVEGIVEIRHLFHERFEDLSDAVNSLESYISVDGFGG